MHPSIEVRQESERGCGYRKVGGIYLVGSDQGVECGRLPIALRTCPCCGGGFKPSRGWTWVDADRLIRACEGDSDCMSPRKICDVCIITLVLSENHYIGQAGLIWVGERFYKSPKHFNDEAAEMGISRRIKMIPHDFVLGETVVLFAHRHATPNIFEDGKYDETIPGIFRIWKPETLEVIVDGTESSEVIEGYLERGLTPVKVEKVGRVEQAELGV